MKFLPLLISRIKSEQPEFFKKLQRVALLVLVLVGITHGVISLDIFHISADIASKLTTACCSVEGFLTGMVGVSFTTTNDPDLASKDLKQSGTDSANKDN